MNKISETHYAKYIKERLGQEILENELGFIIYKIKGDECFIVDGFIESEKRGIGVGNNLQKELIKLAKYYGCKVITANIHLWDKNASKTTLSALHMGYEIKFADANILLIQKNLEE